MKARRTEILIAGGGMVGLSLALELARVLPASCRIVLVEQFPLRGAAQGTYHPSFDARSTALSYWSRRFYDRLGIWERLAPYCQAISDIHVSSRGHPGSALLDARQPGWPALGYVLENAWLGQVLQETALAGERVEIVSPARVAAVQAIGEGMSVDLEGDGGRFLADLLIVADGAESTVRGQLGIAAGITHYGQRALIANVAVAQPHRGRAFERFTKEGPLAFLPLCAAPEAENRCAVVWTLPPERSAELMHCDKHEFLAALQDTFGYRLGRLLDVAGRGSYPLKLVTAAEQVRSSVVVLGNAAHALHPVAGQGFNLALRDAAELATTLAAGVARGRSPGELALLQRYSTRQQLDQKQTVSFSDLLPRLFMSRSPPVVLARELGLSLLDVVTPARGAFIHRMAGMAAGERRADERLPV